MAQQRKVIVTCAITGAIHTPSMSPYLPVTPEEIAQAAIEAVAAGAAIVHLHARNPKDGRPDQSPEAFEPFLEGRGASSTMPQKRNPISCELIIAGAKLLRQHAGLMLDAMVADHERATGPWQVEGVAVPASAVVWWQGRAWIYQRTGASSFTRMTIATDLPAPDGGYIVAAPSWIGPSKAGPGGTYRWEVSPFEVPVPRLPIWLITMLAPIKRPVAACFNDAGRGSSDVAGLAAIAGLSV